MPEKEPWVLVMSRSASPLEVDRYNISRVRDGREYSSLLGIVKDYYPGHVDEFKQIEDRDELKEKIKLWLNEANMPWGYPEQIGGGYTTHFEIKKKSKLEKLDKEVV